ncbi:protein phosphatase regulatory subunit Sds22 [Yamadazyma tenuis]|uniref:L domain-like protein n=1 Tax=Candida tenuis (strain ATCC 10573 / BCRC 21748 / CBS 615 / JCM 9827 / NBRC 10315 / NRRL Y-1498 / VKM Y-70) TaxID=590646 RepID=G3AXY7_CANTC|nr:L domain-like protein [Yamadazyma tenuis ATCC 10573]XP_006684727.1 uncharacterized protein CANTEDRAFT_112589 [Yamadazyma tenuis ATCC 10573]EGV66152.1 L domain-like protein [Yamadazyma tenuis ATCC 10573]EGV66153.1 hypothetical protein CANTEDRAFT_112589 [Yamadazyma tenuis ATCC 10573]WEJ95959.1 protein phosphatase regulatory subunit Sds22 [Yamadazyma tenuis]
MIARSLSADEYEALNGEERLREQVEDLVLSNTDEDDDDDEEIDTVANEANEPLPVEYRGTIIPDPDVQQIEADNVLTDSYEDDTDYLELIHLKIGSLSDLDLGRFTKLESVCFRQNLITSMVDVRDLSDTVEELDFYDNRINHISSNIGKLVNLKNLDLSFNKIKNIKNLEKLTELENLYFVQNKIKEIKNLDNNLKIKNLELGGNKIGDISEMMLKLVNIEQLWLGKNQIPRLQNLQNLKNLRILSIQSNRIEKIEGLESLENLQELYLSHNKISKIENLEHNTKLQVLDVTSNGLKSLSGLSHLKQLTDFWCSYNQISNFNEINRELGSLPELDTVYFEGNPVQTSNPTAYRRKLRLSLGPSLSKIDATYVHN